MKRKKTTKSGLGQLRPPQLRALVKLLLAEGRVLYPSDEGWSIYKSLWESGWATAAQGGFLIPRDQIPSLQRKAGLR